jgi:hypothetical protein
VKITARLANRESSRLPRALSSSAPAFQKALRLSRKIDARPQNLSPQKKKSRQILIH